MCSFYNLQGSQVAEALHFFGHELELSFLLEPLFQAGTEGVIGQTSLFVEDLIGQILLLLVEVGHVRGGFRFNAVHHPVGAER